MTYPTTAEIDNTKNINEHILLVEDDKLLSELLERYLDSYDYHVTTVTTGEEIEASIKKQAITVILLDIMLPGKDGFYWLDWIKNNYPKLPVILCSRRIDPEDRVAGLSQGAVDYIVKPFHPKEVLYRLQKLLEVSKEPEDCYSIGQYDFHVTRGELLEKSSSQEAVSSKLSRQEVVVLQYFCQNVGQVISRDKIAELLYGTGHSASRRNIDMLINRLRNKLGEVSSSYRYLHTVWGKGYRFTLAGEV